MKLLSENTSVHDGRPAGRCVECGGIDFHGIGNDQPLSCSSCSPAPAGATLYQAIAFNGRLRWRRVEAEWGDVPAVDPTGAGGAAVNAAAEASRVDPETPTDLVYVSPTTLAWFFSGLKPSFGRDVTLRRSHGFPDGVYRRLDQAYFAWLVAQQNKQFQVAAYPAEFFEITTAAQIAGVFGDWSRDVGLWPTSAPRGYVGPAEFEIFLPRNWSDVR